MLSGRNNRMIMPPVIAYLPVPFGANWNESCEWFQVRKFDAQLDGEGMQ